MKLILDTGAFMPVRGHADDAGLDLRTPYDFTLAPHSSETINTGVHFDIAPGLVGILKSKSGLNVKHNITCTGVIDAGYTGAVRAKLYNHGSTPVSFKAGDKITQIVFLPVYIPERLIVVKEFEETARGSGGFGSTGR